MKINKSILGISLMALFLFSACSQARYGNLTRRTKSYRSVATVDKKYTPETKKATAIVPEEEVKTEAILTVKSEPETATESVVKLPVYRTAKMGSSIETESTPKLLKKAMERKAERIVKRVEEKVSNSKFSPEEIADDSLIRAVLIIILLLLLAGLVIQLLPPPLNSIVSIVIAVLLILYLISIL